MFVLTENGVPLNQLVDNQIMFSINMTINWVAYDDSLAEYLSQNNSIKIHKIYVHTEFNQLPFSNQTWLAGKFPNRMGVSSCKNHQTKNGPFSSQPSSFAYRKVYSLVN